MPRKKEVEACDALMRDLTNKGRAHMKRQGIIVPRATSATREENNAACLVYMERAFELLAPKVAKIDENDTEKVTKKPVSKKPVSKKPTVRKRSR